MIRMAQPAVQFESNLALRCYALNRPTKLNALDESMIALLRNQVEVRDRESTARFQLTQLGSSGMGPVLTHRNDRWNRSWTCILCWGRCHL